MVRGFLLLLALLTAGASIAAGGASASLIDAAALLHAQTHDDRIVVLGELHGTHEAPALAGGLAKRRVEAGRPVTLALEVHATEQTRIDAFLASAGDAEARRTLLGGAFWANPEKRSDGRRSGAMLALLEAARQMRADGADLRVLAFDPGSFGGDADARNPRMAQALRAAFDRDAERDFVVLTGNYHARRAAPLNVRGGLSPGQTPPVPTMAYLADVPMRRIKIDAPQGEFWACAEGHCGPLPIGGRSGDRIGGGGASEGDAAARFVETADAAAPWDALLWLPSFSAAPPAGRD